MTLQWEKPSSHSNNKYQLSNLSLLIIVNKIAKVKMSNLRAIVAVLVISATLLQQCLVHATFSDSCNFYWGADRGRFNGPDSVELRLNKTGGSGIASKSAYMYGSISAQIKLISGNSAGTVTTFYLSSFGKKHYEIDFEFLGNASGQPYTLHTNIYIEGVGNREQQFSPWFNPTDGYHNYTIFWSPCAVAWLIDGQPIRVFRNFHDKQIGFPETTPMNFFASLWNADSWATQGGRIKTDWSLAPFVASLQKYSANACSCSDESCVATCSQKTPANWWTNPALCQLSQAQIQKMEQIRNNYIIYDYCVNAKKYHKNGFGKECSLPQY